jgi:hypothetical protein
MTDHPHDLIELSLAHAEGRGNSVARSYNRSDALERRRALMEDWGRFLRVVRGRPDPALELWGRVSGGASSSRVDASRSLTNENKKRTIPAWMAEAGLPKKQLPVCG